MVLTGTLSPDPQNQHSEGFSVIDDTNIMPILNDSDNEEEEEEVSYAGYEVLPQDFVENNNEIADDNDSLVSITIIISISITLAFYCLEWV